MAQYFIGATFDQAYHQQPLAWFSTRSTTIAQAKLHCVLRGIGVAQYIGKYNKQGRIICILTRSKYTDFKWAKP